MLEISHRAPTGPTGDGAIVSLQVQTLFTWSFAGCALQIPALFTCCTLHMCGTVSLRNGCLFLMSARAGAGDMRLQRTLRLKSVPLCLGRCGRDAAVASMLVFPCVLLGIITTRGVYSRCLWQATRQVSVDYRHLTPRHFWVSYTT